MSMQEMSKLTTDPLVDVLNQGITVYDLGRPLENGMPQAADHPRFRMTLSRRHGDLMRADGSSGANEVLFTGCHVGTHIDALAHISFDGLLHGGLEAREMERGGRFRQLGAETIPPLVRRGILLDVAAARGGPAWPPDEEIGAGDLQAALDRTGLVPRPGDVLLIRTGWGALWTDRVAFEGDTTGTPGPGEEAARWLAGHRPAAVGSDTIAFERLTPASTPRGLPVHKILIVDHGVYLIELLNLEGLAAAAVAEFVLVVASLPVVGATGGPARPLALVGCPPGTAVVPDGCAAAPDGPVGA
jgi:kynurenine formamidase